MKKMKIKVQMNFAPFVERRGLHSEKRMEGTRGVLASPTLNYRCKKRKIREREERREKICPTVTKKTYN